MFFILKGHCRVRVLNSAGGLLRERVLSESDYFGEIAMFYDCERQATVRSHSYDTFARLNRQSFDQFCSSYPQMRSALKLMVNGYDDRNQRLRKAMIKALPYVNEETPALAVLDLIYSLRQVKLEKD